MPRSSPVSAPVRRPGGEPEARLALAEFLLGCEEASECAQWALDWLAEQMGLRQALCLVPDDDVTQLVPLAAYGVAHARLHRLTVSLDDRDDPLVRALDGNGSVVLPSNGRSARLLGGPLIAVPLAGADTGSDRTPGLLVLTPPSAELAREAAWVADVLGIKLGKLLAARSLASVNRRLERERAVLHTVMNAVQDPILLTDAEGRMILTNARAEALFAATDRESEGRRRATALNNMLFSAALSGRTIVRGEPARRELLLVDPSDGSDLVFELLSAPVTDPRHGEGIVSILRNVTDLSRATEEMEENYRKLRTAEAAVRAERDRLDLIIDSVADPILVTDPAGAIALTNAPAERLFTARATAPDEVTARVRSNDAHFGSFLSNLLFAGETMRYRGAIALLDPETGEALPVEAIAGKVLSAHGELVGVVTILHDQREALERERLYEQLERASRELEDKVRQATTELVRQNELLRRQALQLEQASALKSQFLANMSHEFRTPLNAILGYTSMLLQGVMGTLTPQQLKSLSRVDSSARHLLALINDILDISRIEAGKMPMNIEEFPLSTLVAEVLAEVEPIMARTQLSVSRELAADLPETVTTDRAKVKQIVLNLLTNALKFTPQGWVKVAASYDADTDRVLIAVADSGIGIAEDDQKRVFEDFSQADPSPTRASGGAGLGLSISRRLATMMGGDVTLVSKPGRGSTFTLTIPRTRRP
jgi:PAS domain S-box-containing protein